MGFLLLVLTGLVAGVIGSLVGLGGGIIIVPALLFLSESTSLLPYISPQVAVGTSLVVIIFTSLSSTLAFVKQKKTDYKSAFIFFIGSGPGAIFGSWLNKGMDAKQFSLYFGIVMIGIAILLMIRHRLKPMSLTGGIRKTVEQNGKTYEYGYRPVAAVLISFVVGTISSLFGIGGGALMMPVMLILFAFPPHIAVATSVFLIFLSSLTGSISHIALGHVNWLFVLTLAPGAWVGATLGARLNAKMKADTVVLALRIMLIIIGIRLIFEGL